MAARLILAKGLRDAIGPQKWSKIGYNATDYPLGMDWVSEGDVRLGDWAVYENGDVNAYLRLHPNGIWAAENVVNIGSNYWWGLGLGHVTGEDIRNLLQQMYNHGVQFTNQMHNSSGVKWGGFVNFINISRVATDVFNGGRSQ
jgi:hypothetical protein